MSPSSTLSKRSAPGTSTSATPPRTSRSGPGFGKRPLCDGEQLTTTRTPASSSSSAETRSMSRWSMIATSAEVRRLVRRFVIRSRRAGPRNSSVTLCCLQILAAADRREEVTPAQHPLELLLPLGAVEGRDPRVRRVTGNLLDPEVAFGQPRDLREVSDRDHLRALGGTRERAPDGVRGLAADPRVELVEDQRVAAGDDGDRERDPRELAARGGVRDGSAR